MLNAISRMIGALVFAVVALLVFAIVPLALINSGNSAGKHRPHDRSCSWRPLLAHEAPQLGDVNGARLRHPSMNCEQCHTDYVVEFGRYTPYPDPPRPVLPRSEPPQD
jgi:hypothetical protein